MVKHKKATRNAVNPEDVIAGRVRPHAHQLVALIHEVNPTGLGLDRKETARRYAVKTQLQSSLVRRFPDDIDATLDPKDPSIVALRYRPLDLDACHTVLADLDEDARSTIQHIIDTRDDDEHASVAPRGNGAFPNHYRNDLDASGAPDGDHFDVPTLLREGDAALEAYDYELARLRFEAAFNESGGAREPARALLSLLVEMLAADEEALAMEALLDATAREDGTVRALLAIAAARRGERARALRMVEERGIEVQPVHLAEVFVILTKNALAEGDLAQASSDLARARRSAGTHPEFANLIDALAKAQAIARGPAEAELERLFVSGNMRDAEERARELLARFPESEIGRKIKLAIDEQKRRDNAKERFEEGRAALERGEHAHANVLLRSALSIGLPTDEADWAQNRIAEMENAERIRKEEARVAETLHILTNNMVEGLSFYASLPAASRRKVSDRFAAPALSWLDELFPAGEGGKADGAVAAIVALHYATEIIASDPAAALERLSAHENLLHGFEPAEKVRNAAHVALVEQQRRVAQSRVAAARRAFAEGDAHLASRTLNDVVQKHLPEEEWRSLAELRAEVQNVIERRALEATLAQHRRQGDPVSALGIAQRLVARSEGEEAERFAKVCTELREETRQAFAVRVEHAGADASTNPEWSILYDARIIPKWKSETLIRDVHGGPDDLLFINVQMKAEWMFIRVVEVATGAVRTRVMLRVPIAVDVVHAVARDRRLLLAGRSGALLEIDVDDWCVLRWCPNILPCNDSVASGELHFEHSELTFPDVIVENATTSADGRYLWMNTYYGRRVSDRARRIVHVFDLDGLTLLRDIREHSGARTVCRAIAGLEQPCIAIIHDEEERAQRKTYFYDPRGRPLDYSVIPFEVTPQTLVACPDRKHIFGSTSDPAGPDDPETVQWGITEISATGASPLRMLGDVTAVYSAVAVSSLEVGMCFLHIAKRSGCELFGLRQGDEGLELVYRVPVPKLSSLITSLDGRHAVMAVVHETRHEIIRRGATPPRFDNVENAAPFLLPRLPRGSIYAAHLDCHVPEGKRAAPIIALENELRRLGKSRMVERIRRAMKKGDPDELLALEQALLRFGEPTRAGDLGAHIRSKFANHPRARLVSARTLATVGRWQEVQSLLDPIDPKRLDEADAKHLHHMRGMTRMMMDDPEGALVEFDRCKSYSEGTCDPDELIALCTPLSDTTRQWNAETIVIRDWLRRVAMADAALEQGDATAARHAIDVPILWEANELQSFGRLAEAYLREGEQGIEGDSFRNALALVAFCELFNTRNTMTRREVPLPCATWGDEKLGDIARRVRCWLESKFGGEQGIGSAPHHES